MRYDQKFRYFGQNHIDLKNFYRVMESIPKNLKPKMLEVNRKIAVIAANDLKKNFDSEGVFYGDPWAGLSPATLKNKPSGLKILVRSGELRESIFSLKSSNHKRVVTPEGVEMKSALKVGGHNLFVLHQRGTKAMPARHIYRDESGAGQNVVYVSDRALGRMKAEFKKAFNKIAKEMESGKSGKP